MNLNEVGIGFYTFYNFLTGEITEIFFWLFDTNKSLKSEILSSVGPLRK